MTNATTGPVPGQPYAVIVLTGGFHIERFNFKEPVDALVAGIAYLRDGRQVRLSDRTVAALKEVPALAAYDKVLQDGRPPVGPVDLGPAIALFRAADRA